MSLLHTAVLLFIFRSVRQFVEEVYSCGQNLVQTARECLMSIIREAKRMNKIKGGDGLFFKGLF